MIGTLSTTRMRQLATPVERKMAAEQRLAPLPRVRTTPIPTFGNVAQAAGASSSVNRMPSAWTLTYNNTAGVTPVNLVIGDPNGIVAAASGLTLVQPTTVSGLTPAAFQASFVSGRQLIGGLNYSATSGPTQFGSSLRYAWSDVNGRLVLDPIDVNEYVRNTQFNANLITLEFTEPYLLQFNTAFILSVAAGQAVTITGMLSAAAHR